MRGELWCIWWGSSFAVVYILLTGENKIFRRRRKVHVRATRSRQTANKPGETKAARPALLITPRGCCRGEEQSPRLSPVGAPRRVGFSFGQE